MKILISIFFQLLFSQLFAQNKVYFGKSDSCKSFFKQQEYDSTFLMKVINRCDNSSTSEQVKFEKGMYSRNGVYKEYYDTTFSLIKKTGSFLNGIETGKWKEYYLNGKLKYKGSCKIIKLVKLISDPNEIQFIYMQSPEDTIKLKFSWTVIDSLKKLVQFHYYPPYEMEGFVTPAYFSLKDGTWYYYSEYGKLLKKEFYEYGTLIKSK